MLREKEARRAAYIEGSDLEEAEDEADTPCRSKTENIERLSAATSALIRASSTFHSFSSIVAEVVRNALDAHNVKSVSAELSFAPEWQVRCEDDGEGFEEKAWPGMTWDKVLEISTTATPPFIVGSSSARRSRQSLSQLAHLGTLDILTTVQGSHVKSRLLAQDDDIIFCGPHASAASGSHRGSTVVIRNLFAKLPVRRQALASASAVRAELEECRRLVALESLRRPEVRVKVSVPTSARDRVLLDVGRSPSLASRYEMLYGLEVTSWDFAETLQESRLLETRSGNKVECYVEGFLALETLPSRTHQLMFLNDVCISQHRGGRGAADDDSWHFLNDLYDEMNLHQRNSASSDQIHLHQVVRDVFKKSEVAGTFNDDLDRPIASLLTRSREATPRRLSEYGYLIRLSLREAEPTSASDEHTLSHIDVASAIEDVVEKALERRGFFAHRQKLQETAGGRRPHNASAENQGQKKRRTVPREGEDEELEVPTPEANDYRSIDRSFLNHDPKVTLESIAQPPEWMRKSVARAGPAIATQTSVAQDKAIPSTASPAPHLLGHDRFTKAAATKYELSLALPSQSSSRFFGGTPSLATQASLEKASLKDARHITQVANQFLACVVDLHDGNDEALVLVDQHAADERVGVERLYRRYVEGCSLGTPPTRQLRQPVRIQLSGDLTRQFRPPHAQQLLSYWGFGIRAIDEAGVGSIELSELPDYFKIETLSAHDLSDLVRGLAVWLQEGGGAGRAAVAGCEQEPPTTEEHCWVSALRHMPPRMKDVINSKACRSAIMFSDELSDEQCKKLLCRLAEAAFPFQCAHGRPTMVPICSLSACAAPKERRPIRWHALRGLATAASESKLPQI